MKNPSYLLLSRHNIYYFRWPLPRFLWAQGKTRFVKVSLQTHDPKEALRLANVLEYHAYVITKHESILLMDHGDILNLLRDYFYELINQKKAEIHKHGPLPEAETRALVTQLDYTTDAIEQGRDNILPDEDMHKRLAPIIQRFDVDMPIRSHYICTLEYNGGKAGMVESWEIKDFLLVE